MIAIISALMAEARPLITYFQLQHQQEPSMVRVWGNDNLLVAVTGTGKVKSAAVTSALCQYGNGQIDAVINIGLAGAAFETGLGQLFLTNKIVDHHSQAAYYPEMLLKTTLDEAELRTFDYPVTMQHLQEEKPAYEGLIDMEAAGFFEASLMYLPATRISCLKIVSDFLQGDAFSKEKASQLITDNLSDIKLYIRRVMQLIRDNESNPLPSEIIEMMEVLSDNLNLTITQQRQLEKRIIYNRLTGGTTINTLQEYVTKKSNSKQERNRMLKMLLSRLS